MNTDLKRFENTEPWQWGEEASGIFLEVLTDERTDAGDRLLAAELAGEMMSINEPLIEALLSILRDTSAPEELRGVAALSLGPVLEYTDVEGFDDPLSDPPISESIFAKIRAFLKGLYMDAAVPVIVRRRVLEAAVRAPDDWHEEAVRVAYGSDDEGWKLTAVFAMRWVRGFDNEIADALRSDNEAIHYEAVCAAGNWGLDAAWSVVAALAASEETDKELRLAAIEAMAAIDAQKAGAVLGELLENDDEEIADAAHEALAGVED